MFKLCLPLCAIVLILAGATGAATLDWPANLVAVGPGKSSQALPVAISEESAEALEASSNGVSEEDDLSESSSGSSRDGSSNAADSRIVSAVPVSLPLPLIVAARSGLRTVLTIQEPTVARVGEVVQHVPTAVSHQSQTVVHDHKRVVTPIVAPAVRTTQQVRQQQPLLWSINEPRVVVLRN
ncbi:retinin-like [Scaptodrosophila lebanonensis]|uniref:Retinin-like n=1 Tax=Drosophila lebanonensis TaxID=7225 RepID=A0A6J2UFR4_DROLE|nr:retinin-like [Scaptodrosophila lebanonensis]